MTREPKHRVAFKRMETDDEFRARLIEAGMDPWRVRGESSQKLDDIAWSQKQMQRRIIDDVA